MDARYRRELHVHCYRMLASFEEAEDAVQDTFLRAWRAPSPTGTERELRAWLYRIATNVCLDALRVRRRRPQLAQSYAELPWLQAYPDQLLDEVEVEDGADRRVVERETIALSFLAALQALPPRQRAALIARDVHHWSAVETAEMLNTSVAAANSAVQRARAVMRRHQIASSTKGTSVEERSVLDQFVAAHERGDAALAIAIAARDIRVTMPPLPLCFVGIEALTPLLKRALGATREGDWRLVPTRANRMPAAASYLRRHGDTIFRAYKLDVLRVETERIAEITTFGSGCVARFGLPETFTPEKFAP
jgi:RNA polymerase sigma-70 factor (ECF subfamily)